MTLLVRQNKHFCNFNDVIIESQLLRIDLPVTTTSLFRLFNTRTEQVWQAQIQTKKLLIHCDATIVSPSHRLNIYWQLTSYYNL